MNGCMIYSSYSYFLGYWHSKYNLNVFLPSFRLRPAPFWRFLMWCVNGLNF